MCGNRFGSLSGTLLVVALSLSRLPAVEIEVPLKLPRLDTLAATFTTELGETVDVTLELAYDDRGRIVCGGDCLAGGVDVDVSGKVRDRRETTSYSLKLRGEGTSARIAGVVGLGPTTASIRYRGAADRARPVDHPVTLSAPLVTARIALSPQVDSRGRISGSGTIVSGFGNDTGVPGVLKGKLKGNRMSWSLKAGRQQVSYRGSRSGAAFTGLLKVRLPPESARYPDRTVADFAANLPPLALVAATPTSGAAPLEVEFDGSGSRDPDGQIASHAWNFGDGETGTGAVLTHRYESPGSYKATLTVTDDGGATGSASVTITVTEPGALPPDPADVAPSLDPTVFTDLADATEFLYTGDPPIQTGVAPGTIEAARVAILRGSVLDGVGQPLSGVAITILDHPEFGQTLSREDGRFDLAVNGGGAVTVNYARAGFLPAQRTLDVPWRDQVSVPEVVLLATDSRVTTIDLDAADPIQVARGSPVTDDDGTRQATLLFHGGTAAEMVLADGTTAPLRTLDVRATEYTVGERGPHAMPAELPPASGYTYAVEISADQALAAGATGVRFDRPVSFYVENFLGFPVGLAVPVGYYDRTRAAWVPSPNGRVIAVVGVSSGVAELDVDGDGVADDEGTLGDLGVTGEERRRLAGLYTSGDTLWRVPITHLTPWDCNYPYGPPRDARPWDGPDPESEAPEKDPCEEAGSVIECQNQVLGEVLPITGTGLALHYRSSRVAGRRAAYRLRIPLSGPTPPESLDTILLQIDVAGQRHSRRLAAAPNQHHDFVWDGKDVYGRPVQGERVVTIRIGYTYRVVYMRPAELASAFGRLSGVPLTEVQARPEVILWRTSRVLVGAWVAPRRDLGGWTLSARHVYDPVNGLLYRGDGSRRPLARAVIDTVAGGKFSCDEADSCGDGGPARDSLFGSPWGVAVHPDGSVYVADADVSRIRRIAPDGTIDTVAGTGFYGFGGDGGPATRARLNFPRGVAIGPGGRLYIADSGNNRIRRVEADGTIRTVAGSGASGFGGDGGPARQARLSYPEDLAVAPDGSLYIADSANNRVRYVGPDGVMTTLAGTGGGGHGGDGGPATEAQFGYVSGIALAPDGSLYIADPYGFRIRRVGADGIIETVAGTGTRGFSGDGGPATEAEFGSPWDVAIGPDGSLHVADTWAHCVRRTFPHGVITSVAGSGSAGVGVGAGSFGGDRGHAQAASLDAPFGLDVAPDGSIYIADTQNLRLRVVGPVAPRLASGEIAIVSGDGREVYLFDRVGRHLATRSSLTGTLLRTFDYDDDGLLVAVTDTEGDTVTIERDADGSPLAIVAPRGQRTLLALDDKGYLASISNPAGASLDMTYSDEGLLESFTDARGVTCRFEYDDAGRLVREDDPGEGSVTLVRNATDAGHAVRVESALERSTVYRSELLPAGDRRRVTTFPGGTQASATIGTDGKTSITLEDGTAITFQESPDPRWGMLAPATGSLDTVTPGGIARSQTTDLTATLRSPDDPFSLETRTEKVTINGNSHSSVYEAGARTLTVTTPEGRQAIFTFDAQGRVSREEFKGIYPVSYTYDSHGRLASIAQGTGDEERRFNLGYAASGYLETISDPLGHTLRQTYDDSGRVVSQTLPDGQAVPFSYDASGNLLSLAPPGRPAHGFSYSPVNLKASYTAPDVGPGSDRTEYLYNADRQLTGITRPDGRALEAGYDEAGRLSKVTIARGEVGLEYHPETGQLVSLTSPDESTVRYEYDGFLRTKITWSGSVVGSVSFAHDSDFRVGSLKVNDGAPVSYQYDRDGLLVKAGELTMVRGAETGLITGSTLGTITDTWSYNGFGEAVSFRASRNGTELYSAAYKRDKRGRTIEKTETIGGSTSSYSYTYDLAGRLSAVRRNGEAAGNYEYDDNGNRIGYTGGGLAISGVYDAQDRLTRYGSKTYAYTASGERIGVEEGGQSTLYDYDELGNLVAVTLPDGTLIEYLVDGELRRIAKKVNGSVVQGFLYGDPLRPLAELDPSGNVVSIFVYGSRILVPDYLLKNGKTYRVLSDELGSPRLVIDAISGEIVQRLDYDEFGRVLEDTAPGFQPFGFAAGLYDPDTGLVRFGARDYDAETGRWTTKDPMLFVGGDTNLYAYARNDPVNWVDPEGGQPAPPNNKIDREMKKATDFFDKQLKDLSEKLGSQGFKQQYPKIKELVDHAREMKRRGKWDRIFAAGRKLRNLLPSVGPLLLIHSLCKAVQSQSIEEALESMTGVSLPSEVPSVPDPVRGLLERLASPILRFRDAINDRLSPIWQR